jgi:hypothetical protein
MGPPHFEALLSAFRKASSQIEEDMMYQPNLQGIRIRHMKRLSKSNLARLANIE